MEYHNVRPAVFLERPNRFIARCLTDGGEVTAHVKNTGRCKELLVPGAPVWLCYSGNAARKTPATLLWWTSRGCCLTLIPRRPTAWRRRRCFQARCACPAEGALYRPAGAFLRRLPH